MKRFLAVLLVAIMLLSVIPATSMAISQYATVVGGWLRLRERPSTNSATITSYYTGTQVKILGSTSGWYHVQTPDGRTGYMSASYLRASGGAQPSGTATVISHNGYGVRLRTGPGTGYRVIRTYAVGTQANVLERGSNWSRISINGTVGYMMSQFLNFGGGYDPEEVVCYATIWSRNGYGVRLRTGPGTGYSKIGVYSVGTRVAVLQKGAVWDRIRVGSRVGWMMNDFLDYYGENELTSVALNTLTPMVGNVMSVASIKPEDATVKYEWIRIDGSTSKVVGTGSTYAVTADDEGKTLQLRLTGTGNYTGTIYSAITSKVVPNTLITGVTLNNNAPVAGEKLTASITPAAATADYVWIVNGKQVGGNSAEYTVTTADIGYKVQVVVTGKGQYSGTANTITTSEVKASGKLQGVTIVNNHVGTKAPVVGDELTAVLAPESATATFQWYANGAAISGATSATYTVDAGLVGQSITVSAVGIGNYTGSEVNSMATAPVEAKTLPKLVMGELQLHTDTQTVTWAGVDYATVYQYKFGENGKVSEAQGGESGRIVNYSGHIGETLYVRAVGDGTTYETSDWAHVVCQAAPSATAYRVTVKDGRLLLDNKTEAEYKAGETVSVTADQKDGKTFIGWKATGVSVANSESITFTMPAGEVTLEAQYQDTSAGLPQLKMSALTVDEANKQVAWTAVANATGYKYRFEDGAEGTTAELFISYAGHEGKQLFVSAAGDGTNYASSLEECVTCPAPVATHKVTLVKCTTTDGKDIYAVGDPVTVIANEAAEGETFKGWNAENLSIDSTETTIAFTMPDSDVTVEALYVKDAPATLTKLVMPKLQLDEVNKWVTWAGVDYATVYEYKFGENGDLFQAKGGETGRRVDYKDHGNATLYVRAVGDGTTYETSEWVYITIPTPAGSTTGSEITGTQQLEHAEKPVVTGPDAPSEGADQPLENEANGSEPANE